MKTLIAIFCMTASTNFVGCGQTIMNSNNNSSCAPSKSLSECEMLVSLNILAAYDDENSQAITFRDAAASIEDMAISFNGAVVLRDSKTMRMKVKFRSSSEAQGFISSVSLKSFVTYAGFEPDVSLQVR